jgi:hypothetical protein
MAKILPNLPFCRRVCGREAPRVPPICDLCKAGSRRSAAKMTQKRREWAWCAPLRDSRFCHGRCGGGIRRNAKIQRKRVNAQARRLKGAKETPREKHNTKAPGHEGTREKTQRCYRLQSSTENSLKGEHLLKHLFQF